MRSRVIIIGALVGLVALAAVGLSQEEERPLSPEPDVSGLIAKLGDPDYEVRARAEKEIVALGEKAVPFLEKAAKEHADSHVRFEAERLLELIRGEAKLEEEKPKRERDWRTRLEEHRKWLEEMLRRFEERGLLFEEDLEELLDESVRSPSRSVKGVVERNGERLEYELTKDGHVTVKVTKDGETKTWEAESLEALKEKSPEAYERVRPHLGRGGLFRLEGDPFRFRLILPPWAEPLTPRELPPAEKRQAPPGGFRLGIWVGDVSEPLRVHLKLGKGEGILVEDVVPGSLADRMGVARIDVIRAVNGVPVGSAAEVRKVLMEIEEGGKVDLSVIRKGDPLKLLGTR
ncbi:MAG: HEAT repeat domain-containing protein [Planctomycetota bacterium]|jgi:hypothetical protein